MNVKKTVKELKRLQEVNWETMKQLDAQIIGLQDTSDRIHDLDIELGKLIDALENDGN